ncbi:MAG TPA: hypothetical protein VG370_30440 [Chloroflexota bacterium]|jgi:hypothetical protein|nr:hypothetical protein [Chloroflexota bacterium]
MRKPTVLVVLALVLLVLFPSPAAAADVRTGVVVVGMGCKVQAELDGAGVGHLRLVHPAARGLIRRRATYQAHVAAVLGPHLAPTSPGRRAA